jgi:hypothetical protein
MGVTTVVLIGVLLAKSTELLVKEGVEKVWPGSLSSGPAAEKWGPAPC